MATRKTVPASEFARNFGHYKMLAQREPVAVSSHGRIAGYFVQPDDYEDYLRYKAQRTSFATRDLPDAKVRAIKSARMDDRHRHLDTLLDDE